MSESDGEATFESADEGEGSKTSVKETTVDNKQTDVSNIADEAATLAITDNKEAEDVRPKRATTPTRKANRLQDTEEPLSEADEVSLQEKTMLEKISDVAAKPKNWGWGGISNWGTSVLTSAQSSVTTFAGSVGEGFQNVLDTVEASLVDPEEVKAEERRMELEEAERLKASGSSSTSGASTPSSGAGSPIEAQPKTRDQREVLPTEEGAEKSDEPKPEGEGGWLSGVSGWGIGGITVSAMGESMKKTVKGTTHAFQETGKTLMTGSLDVLESIGKKSYDLLAEGDMGLKQTIKKTKEKPNLSHLLREAKEQAAEMAKAEEEFSEIRKAHYGAQFDEFQGLVQLEALEMLSNQCEGRVQGLLNALKGGQLEVIRGDLVNIKETFELKDMENDDDDEDTEDKDHEFDRLMAEAVGKCGLSVTAEKLIQVQERTRKVLMDARTELDDGTQKEPKELHQQAIQSLAEFTARSIELFHRIGQLILHDKVAPVSSYKTKAASLASVTRVLCTEIGISSSKFTNCLGTIANSIDNPVSVNPMITNVFLEASNSSTYIQDGFQLLLPVLQQGVIDAHQRSQASS